jgi:hypothetical protein
VAADVGLAHEITARARETGVKLRLLGGLAIRLRCPSAEHRSLRRQYGDLDFVAPSSDLLKLEPFFESAGFEPWLPFNRLNAETSQRFDHRTSLVSVDVFIGRLVMCHTLELANRLDAHEQTLSLADLLLSKLQIVQMNGKDVQDIVALLTDHELVEGETGESIDVTRIVQVCSTDWGWYRTVRQSLEGCSRALPQLLNGSAGGLVERRLGEITERIESAPKSRRWKLRAKVGERRRWYEVPEDPTRP